jgi:hypothetical protein
MKNSIKSLFLMVNICSIPMSVPMFASFPAPTRLDEMTGPQRGGGAEPEDVGTGGGSHGAAQRNEGTEGDLTCIWENYNDLTATSLGMMVSKGNHPQMALIQVSEIL